MFLLCLIAALSGTPLRQAEAASDFIRSVSEIGEGDVIETIDGGVGDDQELSIVKSGSDSGSRAPMILAALNGVHVTPLFPIPHRRAADDQRFVNPSQSRFTIPNQRFAWLQCFLF
jgi:hypothetical protein